MNIFAHRFDRAQEFSLFDGEGAEGEIYGSALLQEEQNFEEGYRVLAAGNGNGDVVTGADHIEAVNRFADLPQQCFFDIHSLPE